MVPQWSGHSLRVRPGRRAPCAIYNGAGWIRTAAAGIFQAPGFLFPGVVAGRTNDRVHRFESRGGSIHRHRRRASEVRDVDRGISDVLDRQQYEASPADQHEVHGDEAYFWKIAGGTLANGAVSPRKPARAGG